MQVHPYVHLDVFSSVPLGGNPLAVFLEAKGFDAARMQSIAREMNHSITAFVLPPERGGAACLRIFTPDAELPFAGHPILGSAFAVALARIASADVAARMEDLVFEVGGSDVPVSMGRPEDGGFIWMTQRPPEAGSTFPDVNRLARALGIGHGDIDGVSQVWSTGVPFLFVPITGLMPMGRLRPNPQILVEILREAGARGVYAFTRETKRLAASLHARSFPSGVGISEDAATGSAAGALAGWLVAHQWKKPGRLEIEQGVEMGRPSVIVVDVPPAGESVRVGGRVISVGRGELIF